MQKAISYLQGELKTYNDWSSGQVYGVSSYKVCTECGGLDEVNAVWGFYGLEYAIQEAKSWLEYEAS